MPHRFTSGRTDVVAEPTERPVYETQLSETVSVEEEHTPCALAQAEKKPCGEEVTSGILIDIEPYSPLRIMGIENSWTVDDDLTGPPIPSSYFTVPLPASSTVEINTYGETSVDNGPFSEELDCLFSPMEQGTEVQEDIPCDGEAGVCGLRNLGNTCFMGAGVQCLMVTPPLVAALLASPGLLTSSPLAAELVRLAKRIWSGRFTNLHPHRFKTALAERYPQFNDYRQHDCQEFLALLLDALHEQMNTALSKDFTCQVEIFPEWKLGGTQSEAGRSMCVDEEVDSKEDVKSRKRVNVWKGTPGRRRRPGEMNNAPSEPVTPPHNSTIPLLNNAIGHLSGLEDILKEAKTSNVNVLAVEQEANNEIRFDSEKYPKVENTRRREDVNVNWFDTGGGGGGGGGRGSSGGGSGGSGKRCWKKKPLNDYWGGGEGLGEGLKRVRLLEEDEETCAIASRSDKNRRMEMERASNTPLDKNSRMEHERQEGKVEKGGGGDGGAGPSSAPGGGTAPEEEADKHWRLHLEANRSVVVDTFQGQFKSTVVCSTCEFVSVTYEPFMYLSVPLPNALKKLINVTYVSREREATELVVEVGREENGAGVVREVRAAMGRGEEPVFLCHVLDHHVTRILDENVMLRELMDSSRRLYVFELVEVKADPDPEGQVPSGEVGDSGAENAETTVTQSGDNDSGEASGWCTICLEERETEMRRHIGCTCLLCDVCVVASCEHHGGDVLECPVCRRIVDPTADLIPLSPSPSKSVRMMNVSVVYRLDEEGDGNNNRKRTSLLGHPGVIRAPSKCSASALHSALGPKDIPYRLLLVDGQGMHCSRCLYHSHCRGCPLGEEGEVNLHSSDSLAISFSTQPLFISPSVIAPVPIAPPRPPLTLYDCIRAFSQSESLDEQNPWYCPRCRKNQCATKTLSIWRYPDYLIVYLKRFIFHDRTSTKLEEKVTFPLQGLELDPRVPRYDLYACVCHCGGVSAGHYTTYTEHPLTGEWHHFNDSYVSKLPPQEDDFANAYILFYRKQGIKRSGGLDLEREASANLQVPD